MAMKMVYFSYPYTEDPKGNTERIKSIVREILDHRKDILPIIPHLTFDSLFGYPVGYDHDLGYGILRMEYEIISRCDLLAYDPRNISTGVMWEIAFAKWIGKEILTFDHLRDQNET